MTEASFNFRNWIEEQKGPYTLSKIDQDHYTAETPYGLAEINFYHIEDTEEIVELRITSKKTNTTKFFLHFQPVEASHCKELYNEMISSLLALKDVHITKVLLFCTAGMTTSFFAEKMNDLCKMSDQDYAFRAVSINEVYANAKDYEVILIAPQVAYEEKNIRKRLPEKLILRIPTTVFATYDANGCIEYVKENLEKYRLTKKKKKSCCSCCKENQKGKFLVIATAPSEGDTRIKYRIYDHGAITLDRMVIKKYLDLSDIDDIIHVLLLEHTFDAISIAVPGVLQDGKLDLPRTAGSNLQGTATNLFDLKKYYKKITHIPVILENNANCAALGWYSTQSQYQNICFMSQPNGWLIGGQGIIVNGKLIRGNHGIAGEIKYILNEFQIEKPLSLNPYHLDTIKQIVTKAILANIAILDPEVIVLRCEMLPDPEEIREELKKYLPDYRIPPIVHIDDFNDYVLLGQQDLCIEYLKRED